MNLSDDEMRKEVRFEHDLMCAMRHVDAPHGFVNRVMNAKGVAAEPARAISMRQTVRAWLTGAIAAGLVVGVLFAEQQHLRRQREEMVQRQFEVALRITDHALEHTREQLARAASGFGD
ncbi:MAG TPA: hypothetical protein VGU46_02375 [Acidobacteriaceae bacterium]|nr:hypothetical protein [Acidobacteriaceae bacterium]